MRKASTIESDDIFVLSDQMVNKPDICPFKKDKILALLWVTWMLILVLLISYWCQGFELFHCALGSVAPSPPLPSVRPARESGREFLRDF